MIQNLNPTSALSFRHRLLAGTIGFVLLLPSVALSKEATLTAKLVDRDTKALAHSATIAVVVTDFELVDSPDSVAHSGQGHLHYRVDDGFVVATTATKIGLHELSPGPHRMEVRLVGNDHVALGPVVRLEVTIPGTPAR